MEIIVLGQPSVDRLQQLLDVGYKVSIFTADHYILPQVTSNEIIIIDDFKYYKDMIIPGLPSQKDYINPAFIPKVGKRKLPTVKQQLKNKHKRSIQKKTKRLNRQRNK